ncbi:MAG: hypothetical protein ACPIOQ_44240, partial [Promethearchaeia archaeon]
IGLKIQNNFRALMTDEYLEVQGAKDVYSLGDCASIAPKRLTEHVQVSLRGSPASLFLCAQPSERARPRARTQG